MRYLFGDSTESNLDFNYLAFLREAIDCAVVLVQCDVTLAEYAERKRTQERESETALAAIADFGKRAAEFVAPVADDKAGTPVGRCAAAVAAAIRDAVEEESTITKAKLTAEREEQTKQGQTVHKKAREAFEKLLRAHDLPSAEKEIDVTWNAQGGVKATMRQRTSFGVDAVLALDLPAGSLLYTPDLRVDRVSEGVGVHVREAGGWLKKGDKLVAIKLGRYHVAAITISKHVKIQLRADNNSGDLMIVATPGDMTVAASGGTTQREVIVDERDRPGLRALVDKLEAAARALADARGSVVALEIDGKSMTDHGSPRTVAERLTAAIGPTVQKIKVHSRSPGELVLRRLLGDNRREEIFVSIDELVQKLAVLPAQGRGVFAPLQLQGESDAVAAAAIKSTATKPVEAAKSDTKPVDTKPERSAPEKAVAFDVKSVVEPKVSDAPPEGRPKRITGTQVPMPDRSTARTESIPTPVRTKEPTSPFGTPAEGKRPQSMSSPPPAALPVSSTPTSSSPSLPSVAAVPPVPPVPNPPKSADDDEWPSISKSDDSAPIVTKS
ncbi:MAG TPA: hypothetical protein VIV11_21175 [Kofleriaceae bacterium]